MAEVKTLQGWHEFAERTGQSNWDDYCKPGDEIDRETYDYFLDILPPRTMSRGYFQVGEPYSHAQDEDGKWKATWSTFCRSEHDDGSPQYIYLGNCFAGKDKNIERRELA